MIERKFVAQNIKEHSIEEFIRANLKGVGHSFTKLQRTPMGEKITIHVSRPGLVVGREGQNIKNLTKALKKRFGLENPQIEINEVGNVNLDAHIVAERIANSLERFGAARFKGIGHKVMEDVMKAGGLGIEIKISGKIPSARAKSWRFYQGYLKKCGDTVSLAVKTAYADAQLKTGTVGIQVRIMSPNVKLPDGITFKDLTVEPEVKEEVKAEEKVEPKKETKKKSDKPKKKEPKKKEEAKVAVVEEPKKEEQKDEQ